MDKGQDTPREVMRMSEQNQLTTFTSVQSLPVKRKRGRKHVENPASGTPKSATLRRNPSSNAKSPSDRDEVLGQAVSGVLDGSFNDGYFITVKVGTTNRVLRGFIFKPNKVIPISQANDVASNVKMFKRNEIQMGIPSQFKGNNKHTEMFREPPLPVNVLLPGEQASDVVNVSPRIQSCNSVTSKRILIDINQVPQALEEAEKSMSLVHIPAGGKPNDDNLFVQPSSQSNCSQKALEAEVLQNKGILSQTEAAINCGNGIIDSELENIAAPSVGTFQGNGTVNKVPEVGNLAIVPAEPIGDPIMNGKDFEEKQSEASGSQCVTSQLIAELSKMWKENHIQSKEKQGLPSNVNP